MFLRDNRYLRDKRVLAGVAVLLIAAVAGAFVLFGGSDDDVAGPPPNPAEELAERDPSILSLSGTSLVRKEIDGSNEEIIDTLDAVDVSASQVSDWLAYVAVEGKGAEPRLTVLNAVSGEEEEVGSGVSPIWSETRALLAYLRPVDAGACPGGLECAGDSTIRVFDPATGSDEQLGETGPWELLGFVDGAVLAFDRSVPDTITAFSMDGSTSEIEAKGRDILAISPDGSTLLMRKGEGYEFVGNLGDPSPTKDPVPTQGRSIEAAAWSHDGTRVALILGPASMEPVEEDPADKKKKKGAPKEDTSGKPGQKEKKEKPGGSKGAEPSPEPGPTEIAVLSPGDDQFALVEETFAAQAPLLWGSDNQHLLFLRYLEDRDAYQGYYCPVESEGECTVLAAWSEGVRILRIG